VSREERSDGSRDKMNGVIEIDFASLNDRITTTSTTATTKHGPVCPPHGRSLTLRPPLSPAAQPRSHSLNRRPHNPQSTANNQSLTHSWTGYWLLAAWLTGHLAHSGRDFVCPHIGTLLIVCMPVASGIVLWRLSRLHHHAHHVY